MTTRMEPGHARTEEPNDDSEESSGQDAIASMSRQWRAVHKARTNELAAALRRQHPHAPEDERLLLELAANDLSLSELLEDSAVQLASRMNVLLENPKLVLALARTIREVSKCQESATRRVVDILQAAGVLRGQRRLAQVVPLRRAG